ncbi:EamA family transporter RarD [Volucribacter amazonae]|uniref:Transporter n=1 Tax=Volucribacter amazonae TaxID=256731 RepID=A0A9X4PF89_9PAST|nr:EamA family transporter RarD [Volucribacter amazonae]MDG6894115.1 transporter [Volucribacter amazonae]
MKSYYQGLIICVISQCLFGSLYLFSYAMQPLAGTEIFALRMLVMAIGLWLLVITTLPAGSLRGFIRNHLGTSGKRWSLMLLCTTILASQLWLFMWAPINQEGANVAMGYFLFPLMMVLAGRIWRKEQLSPLQALALCLAMIGVGYEFYQHLSFSWTTLFVALFYPPYYLIRRAMNIPALLGLTFDISIIAPIAFCYLYSQTNAFSFIASEPRFYWLLALLGIVSTLAMYFNLLSSAILPLKLFGLLSYLEPALLFLCAVFLLDTPIQTSAYISYGFIWAGLLVLVINGFLHSKK